MGRHAADGPGKPPLHADLFAPAPGSAAARVAQQRAGVAFEALVAPHRVALETFVARLTGGDETATERILKETYYRAAQDPSLYPQRPAAVRPWLVLTARTILRDGRRVAGHDDHFLAMPVPAVAQPLASTIIGALKDLPDVQRDALVEVFYQGVSLQDAAAARGEPVETLKSRLYFAMRALRVVLDQHSATPSGPAERRRG